jgi:hypothetical protein
VQLAAAQRRLRTLETDYTESEETGHRLRDAQRRVEGLEAALEEAQRGAEGLSAALAAAQRTGQKQQVCVPGCCLRAPVIHPLPLCSPKSRN